MAVHELAVIGSHRPKPEYGFGATGSIMERGAIDVANLAGPFDLQATVESGQSYLWNRADGRTYEDLHAYGGDAWYETVVDPIPGVVDERALSYGCDRRAACATGLSTGNRRWTRSPLGNTYSGSMTTSMRFSMQPRIFPSSSGRTTRTRGCASRATRVFPCLISFICSAQMRVARIHGMQRRLRETYGDAVTVDGEEYRAFPTPDQLASRTESELRDLARVPRSLRATDRRDDRIW